MKIKYLLPLLAMVLIASCGVRSENNKNIAKDVASTVEVDDEESSSNTLESTTEESVVEGSTAAESAGEESTPAESVTEEPETIESGTEDTITDDISNEKSASESADNVAYVNFDRMHFWINGVEFVLGESTLQDMIDSGVVPFNEADLEDAHNNLQKNTQSGGFSINLEEYWQAQVYFLNDTDEGKPINECYICEIYLPNQPEKTQNILEFDFPLNLTMDELKANAGEPEDENYSHYDGDNGYYTDKFKYTRESTKYFGSSYFSFEFMKGELKYIYINYLP